MNPHILIYTDDPGVGGVAQYNHAIALGLLAVGYRVTLVQSRRENPLLAEQAQAGVQHQWLDYDTQIEFSRTVSDPSDAQTIFEQTQPDLVLFSDGSALSNLAAREAALQMGIPFMSVMGMVAPDLTYHLGPDSDPEPILNILEHHFRAARAVVAVSQDNLEALHRLYRLPANKGQVIHYGRPDSYFAPRSDAVRQRLRNELGISKDGVLCLTAARLEPVKGYEILLAAIAQLQATDVGSQLYFAWAGDGSLQDWIQDQIEALGVGDRIFLLGQRWDIADWYDAADVFVLPSYLEGMPLAIMEAMAKGLPVVASAVSGIPEALGDTGQLLPNPNLDPNTTAAELAETLTQWANQPDLRRILAERGRSRARQLFRLDRMVSETIDVVQRSLLPMGDYVSPGLAIVQPDAAFPHMTLGDRHACPWPYLRREIPHNWYVDARYPIIGFLSRDEAQILHNLARQFAGQRALEIGCWMGWSACHLALAGVTLDVVDPLLEQPEIYDSVSGSLAAAGVGDRVTLFPGYSPQKVEDIANQHQRLWSLIFIDGNHEAPGPLQDAIACEALAAEDALIVFHDLTSPDVAQGLDYFRQQGWNTLVYQTMQIMGIAWRGNVQPVSHQPDPSVNWTVPPHLQHYEVCGMASHPVAIAPNPSDVLGQLLHQVEQLPPIPIPTHTDATVAPQIVDLERVGRTAFVKGDWDAAQEVFEQAIALNSGAAIAHAHLSHLYWQHGNLALSLRHHAWANQAHEALGQSTYSEFQALMDTVRPYTLLSEYRLFSLYALAKQICLEDVPGNFVECGTFKGGASALLAAVIQRYSQRPRKLYACDTYEGMPDPVELDKHDGIPANETGFGAGTLKAPLEENLQVVCEALGVTDVVVPLKGLFQDTLPQHRDEIGAIALLHADGDWYESTLDIFNLLYDQVVPQGVVQIDDYGFWEGCRQAIHEFERARQIHFPLRAIDFTGVWFRKDSGLDGASSHWQMLWHIARTAEQLGDMGLAMRTAQATLKLIPALVEAETMLTRLHRTSAPTPTADLSQFRLRSHNVLAFPDWNQPEEVLFDELARLFRTAIAQPEPAASTLLVTIGEIDPEEADLAISSVLLHLLSEEALEMDESGPDIVLLSQVTTQQWRSLLPHVAHRLDLPHNDEAAMAQAGAHHLPIQTIAAPTLAEST
ncbi:TylF/MycF/NovP-related O-methyltransferase [Leptolyngbya sp. AN02str]|uniref:TylF/MycF/NovP-related O-methyltransferase n=1 Tax=Leptolyngbya sp. AN02str TaxID=3423363 RepID=UPI003D3213CA